VKYDHAEGFLADYHRLTPQERALFRAAVQQINEAFAHRGDRPIPTWPAELRIKRLRRILGVWEMTWSFSGPDGRATFEFIAIEGELGILWRRIGDHRIFMRP
jgi:hypothetical protein